MNFASTGCQPHWAYGYPAVILVSAGILLGSIWYSAGKISGNGIVFKTHKGVQFTWMNTCRA
ncbi:MAG: hypothetical protein ACLU9S_03610 [Oscillospiraceae bacterium]